MHWMHQYATNRNVFNSRLKLFPSMTGSRKLSGREFQTDEPATEKARRMQLNAMSTHRAYTRLARKHRASVACVGRYAGVAISIGRTCAYR